MLDQNSLIDSHLDKDLAALRKSTGLRIEIPLLLQVIRLMRGRTLPIVETPIEGWSPDGKTWLSSQPGTLTQQETKNEQK